MFEKRSGLYVKRKLLITRLKFVFEIKHIKLHPSSRMQSLFRFSVHCITEDSVKENLMAILFVLRTCLWPSYIACGFCVAFAVVVGQVLVLDEIVFFSNVFVVVEAVVVVAVFVDRVIVLDVYFVVVVVVVVVVIFVVSAVIFVANLTVGGIWSFALVRLRHDDYVRIERAVIYIA